MKLGKKLLSLLTVLCLSLSLFPTMAFAADDGEGIPGSPATSVRVGSTTLSVGNYLTSNGTVTTTKPDEDTGYIHFSTNGQLTLNNYIGSSKISITGNLTINLVGTNKITTSGNNSIYSDGALTIMSSSKGSLTAENPTSGSAQTTIYSTSNITITGNATVTATINGTAQAINSHSENGTITIADHATVTATNTNNTTTTESGIAILAGNRTNGSGGTIEVKDSATLTAQGYGKALACQTFSATGTVKASTDYQPETPVDYGEDDLGSYKYVKVTPAVVNYDVWVGNKQVTSANKDNVLGVTNANGTPTVTYTPDTNTLTLNKVNITNTTENTSGIKASNDLTIALIGENNTISGSGHAIQMTNGTLTITGPGSLNASSSSGQTTIYTQGSGDVIINGGAQITVENTNSDVGDAIHLSGTTNKNLTITGNGTQLIARKTAGNQVAINGVAKLTVNNGAILLAQSNDTAISCTTFNPDSTSKVEVAEDYNGTTPSDYNNSTTLSNCKYVHVYPKTASVEHYGVWIGSTELTSANKNSIQNGVTYDPDTKTLTLTNAAITGARNRQYTSTITDACGIYAKHDLTIKLSGSNTVIGSENADEQEYGNYGIFVSGRLTFTSASDSVGSLTVSGGKSNNSGNAWVPGVYASGITVKNCNVTAMGGTASDSYPVAYAMSKAPTLVGAKVVKTSTTNRAADATENNYIASSISKYKYLEIKQDTTDTSVAAPVIAPEGGYFTSDPHVTISCPTDGATIYYTTNGNAPSISEETKYTENSNITLQNETTTVKAIAVKTINGKQQQSALVEAKFTKREPGKEVTEVTLSLDARDRTLKVGDTSQLTATVKHKNSEISGLTVTWASDNTDVATVDKNGKITALAVGKARITAAVVENGVTYSDFCDVIVEARPSSSHHSSSSTTYYDVNAAVSGEGGSVAASTKRASRGTTVTVTATAASGYQVAQVSAVDKDGKTVSLTDKGDGVYTFVMPASKVDVTARFAQVQKPEEKDPYGDVSKDSYYYDAVKWAAETGVTTGVGDGLFAPEWVCTRGQIVTFLWRASGSPAPKATELPFTDVAADAYYAQAVLWAVENGITNGTSETTFSPDQTCTRAHAVAFLYRMSGSPAAAGSTFSDVAADAYYRAAVAWAVEKGITNGTSGTTFSPDDTCTRGQIVTFLYRLAQTK